MGKITRAAQAGEHQGHRDYTGTMGQALSAMSNQENALDSAARMLLPGTSHKPAR
jgi:hypothetical protein